MKTKRQPKYTLDYFIKKYSSIPAKSWCTGDYIKNYVEGDKCCAVGHTLKYSKSAKDYEATPETIALANLVKGLDYRLPEINDGHDERYPQKSIKARVLAFLKDMKAKEKLNAARV